MPVDAVLWVGGTGIFTDAKNAPSKGQDQREMLGQVRLDKRARSNRDDHTVTHAASRTNHIAVVVSFWLENEPNRAFQSPAQNLPDYSFVE